jgi:hypothetical protein
MVDARFWLDGVGSCNLAGDIIILDTRFLSLI